MSEEKSNLYLRNDIKFTVVVNVIFLVLFILIYLFQGKTNFLDNLAEKIFNNFL